MANYARFLSKDSYFIKTISFVVYILYLNLNNICISFACYHKIEYVIYNTFLLIGNCIGFIKVLNLLYIGAFGYIENKRKVNNTLNEDVKLPNILSGWSHYRCCCYCYYHHRNNNVGGKIVNLITFGVYINYIFRVDVSDINKVCEIAIRILYIILGTISYLFNYTLFIDYNINDGITNTVKTFIWNKYEYIAMLLRELYHCYSYLNDVKYDFDLLITISDTWTRELTFNNGFVIVEWSRFGIDFISFIRKSNILPLGRVSGNKDVKLSCKYMCILILLIEMYCSYKYRVNDIKDLNIQVCTNHMNEMELILLILSNNNCFINNNSIRTLSISGLILIRYTYGEMSIEDMYGYYYYKHINDDIENLKLYSYLNYFCGCRAMPNVDSTILESFILESKVNKIIGIDKEDIIFPSSNKFRMGVITWDKHEYIVTLIGDIYSLCSHVNDEILDFEILTTIKETLKLTLNNGFIIVECFMFETDYIRYTRKSVFFLLDKISENKELRVSCMYMYMFMLLTNMYCFYKGRFKDIKELNTQVYVNYNNGVKLILIISNNNDYLDDNCNIILNMNVLLLTNDIHGWIFMEEVYNFYSYKYINNDIEYLKLHTYLNYICGSSVMLNIDLFTFGFFTSEFKISKIFEINKKAIIFLWLNKLGELQIVLNSIRLVERDVPYISVIKNKRFCKITFLNAINVHWQMNLKDIESDYRCYYDNRDKANIVWKVILRSIYIRTLMYFEVIFCIYNYGRVNMNNLIIKLDFKCFHLFRCLSTVNLCTFEFFISYTEIIKFIIWNALVWQKFYVMIICTESVKKINIENFFIAMIMSLDVVYTYVYCYNCMDLNVKDKKIENINKEMYTYYNYNYGIILTSSVRLNQTFETSPVEMASIKVYKFNVKWVSIEDTLMKLLDNIVTLPWSTNRVIEVRDCIYLSMNVFAGTYAADKEFKLFFNYIDREDKYALIEIKIKISILIKYTYMIISPGEKFYRYYFKQKYEYGFTLGIEHHTFVFHIMDMLARFCHAPEFKIIVNNVWNNFTAFLTLMNKASKVNKRAIERMNVFNQIIVKIIRMRICCILTHDSYDILYRAYNILMRVDPHTRMTIRVIRCYYCHLKKKYEIVMTFECNKLKITKLLMNGILSYVVPTFWSLDNNNVITGDLTVALSDRREVSLEWRYSGARETEVKYKLVREMMYTYLRSNVANIICVIIFINVIFESEGIVTNRKYTVTITCKILYLKEINYSIVSICLVYIIFIGYRLNLDINYEYYEMNLLPRLLLLLFIENSSYLAYRNFVRFRIILLFELSKKDRRPFNEYCFMLHNGVNFAD